LPLLPGAAAAGRSAAALWHAPPLPPLLLLPQAFITTAVTTLGTAALTGTVGRKLLQEAGTPPAASGCTSPFSNAARSSEAVLRAALRGMLGYNVVVIVVGCEASQDANSRTAYKTRYLVALPTSVLPREREGSAVEDFRAALTADVSAAVLELAGANQIVDVTAILQGRWQELRGGESAGGLLGVLCLAVLGTWATCGGQAALPRRCCAAGRGRPRTPAALLLPPDANATPPPPAPPPSFCFGLQSACIPCLWWHPLALDLAPLDS